MKRRFNNTNLFITQGEVIKDRTDILVNWTVPRLNGGDDLFFKIHKEGGSTIYKDCQRILASLAEKQSEDTPTDGIVPVGRAVVTTAGILPTKFIIHAVVPDYRTTRVPGEHKKLLNAAINNTLLLISQYSSAKERVSKVTFTPVPSLIYGADNTQEAVELLIQLLKAYAEKSDLRSIKIVCQNPEDYKLYSNELYKQTSTGLERFINKFFKLSA